jgi:hypothetical protein
VRPVREGDRGPAVEDIQRRLLRLDYDLGPTGVDGVFMGATLAAVRSFQDSCGLPADGVVDAETWSALVDATFTLGDRLLYLRFPYLHGRDVTTLQRILNALGFPCGDADGIFGSFTERAVRDFQMNVGQAADGIVGAETVAAVTNLRHVWDGREADRPASSSAAPARSADVLSRSELALVWSGGVARDVAERVANLALATEPGARVRVVEEGHTEQSGDLAVRIASCDVSPTVGIPVVQAHDVDAGSLESRVVTALASERPRPQEIVVDLGGVECEERVLQSLAVGLLDGVCAGLT